MIHYYVLPGENSLQLDNTCTANIQLALVGTLKELTGLFLTYQTWVTLRV